MNVIIIIFKRYLEEDNRHQNDKTEKSYLSMLLGHASWDAGTESS